VDLIGRGHVGSFGWWWAGSVGKGGRRTGSAAMPWCGWNPPDRSAGSCSRRTGTRRLGAPLRMEPPSCHAGPRLWSGGRRVVLTADMVVRRPEASDGCRHRCRMGVAIGVEWVYPGIAFGSEGALVQTAMSSPGGSPSAAEGIRVWQLGLFRATPNVRAKLRLRR